MNWKRNLIIMGSIVLVATASFGVTFGIVNHNDVSRLTSQSQAYARQMKHLQAEVRTLSGKVTSLSGQVASVNVPSDPLSAYNEICHQDMTNSGTGITQPFYFPCTNQAQTIPQPGN